MIFANHWVFFDRQLWGFEIVDLGNPNDGYTERDLWSTTESGGVKALDLLEFVLWHRH